jgi:hypothetical protein
MKKEVPRNWLLVVLLFLLFFFVFQSLHFCGDMDRIIRNY